MLFEKIKSSSLGELYKTLEERKKELFHMRVLMRSGQEFKANKFREVRRDIAKLFTRITQIKQGKGV